ncbi:hypothetical protein [Opitutus terrae]|uniref:Uncharacterized protein n=1 Tax=Opitutus terrae (strain DSM 11246 / JCM 15787 / PB90-1) TaxID=452637 RepID=B1ZNS0_OPITP|nr:hypothetical protein [Opitutus terrae]ACB75440.1 hypothetical protein Oter_2157 [Opitutus terrae PB90-1]
MGTETSPLAAPYKDRKAGLIVFGILEILIGAFFLFSLAATAVSRVVLAHRPELAQQYQGSTLWPTLLINGGLVVVFVWLGIGSLLARRWARAISLCLGWIGLISGVIACVSMAWVLPAIDAAMQQAAEQNGQHLSAGIVVFVKILTVSMMLLMYVIIPGALVLFYRSRHVRLTCETRDPVERWTDRCPLPVLALVLLLAFSAVAMVMTIPLYGRAFPFFGMIITGAPALVLFGAFAVFCGAAARGLYRLQPWALWSYAVVVVVFAINSAVTFTGGGLMRYYEAIGLPEAQLKQIEAMKLLQTDSLIWFGTAAALVFLGYLIWLRKYFTTAPTAVG